jgi:hypothetical protein
VFQPPQKSAFEQLRVGASRGRVNLPQTPFFVRFVYQFMRSHVHGNDPSTTAGEFVHGFHFLMHLWKTDLNYSRQLRDSPRMGVWPYRKFSNIVMELCWVP